MPITQILTSVFWLGLIIFVLLSKKKFIFPETTLSKKSIIFLIFISTIILVFNVSVFGVAYYKAFYPDFGYTQISKQVSFRIYLPGRLPSGDEEVSKFYFGSEIVPGKKTVRVTYDISISSAIKGQKSKAIVISQTQVSPGFDIENNVQLMNKLTTPPVIAPIELSKIPGTAYLQTSDFVNTVYFVTPDNVLIEVSSVSETTDNLITIANNME